ncbi:MAG: CBS domain-containing protein, partial [Candidatus Micrarchaeota archaeon]
GDCMRKGVVTLKATETAHEAAKLMKKHRIGSVVVTRDQKAVGIVTETDITYKIVANGKDPKKTPLKRIMSSPLKTTKTDAKINDVANLMRDRHIKRVPVVDNDQRLVGIISDDDLISVYPALVEVLIEDYKMHEFGGGVFFAGVCEVCGSYSETLEKSRGKFACEECREEEEV